MFPQAHVVREAQKELDDLIQRGVMKITRLLKNTEMNFHEMVPKLLNEEHKVTFNVG